MAAYVGAKHLCGPENRRMLIILIEIGGRKCCCPPCSKIYYKVCNGVTIGGWPGCVEGGLAATLMLLTLSSATRDPPCCLFGTAWSACVCQISCTYTHGGSL